MTSQSSSVLKPQEPKLLTHDPQVLQVHGRARAAESRASDDVFGVDDVPLRGVDAIDGRGGRADRVPRVELGVAVRMAQAVEDRSSRVGIVGRSPAEEDAPVGRILPELDEGEVGRLAGREECGAERAREKRRVGKGAVAGGRPVVPDRLERGGRGLIGEAVVGRQEVGHEGGGRRFQERARAEEGAAVVDEGELGDRARRLFEVGKLGRRHAARVDKAVLGLRPERPRGSRRGARREGGVLEVHERVDGEDRGAARNGQLDPEKDLLREDGVGPEPLGPRAPVEAVRAVGLARGREDPGPAARRQARVAQVEAQGSRARRRERGGPGQASVDGPLEETAAESPRGAGRQVRRQGVEADTAGQGAREADADGRSLASELRGPRVTGLQDCPLGRRKRRQHVPRRRGQGAGPGHDLRGGRGARRGGAKHRRAGLDDRRRRGEEKNQGVESRDRHPQRV